MVSITIYVEGGGNNNKRLARDCRKAFHEFFEKTELKGELPAVIPCGGRNHAYDDFCTALKQSKPNHIPLLLVDSEVLVADNATSWSHLKSNDGWTKPQAATDDHAHLMVQCMEIWFLADVNFLQRFYGHQFRSTALPKQADLEKITKADLFNALKQATKYCENKGEYHKGRHSFKILEEIDPQMVRQRSIFAKRLIEDLLRLVSS
jgi:hypothetical protein